MKQLPKEALSGWAFFYKQVQQNFKWPLPLAIVGYALLPKNAESERPIALTSLWYRLLIKCRLHLLERWLQSVRPSCPWDRAVAGCTVFKPTLTRMLRAELMQHAQTFQVSLLVDLTHCFDRMNLQKLLRFALKREFPPGLLALAIPVHAGPRVLMAEGMHSLPVWPERGILPGCSLSVSLTKLYLWDTLEALQQHRGLIDSSTWVDDLSFDLVGSDPPILAQQALALFDKLSACICDVELLISIKKSGFLVSHVAVKRELESLLAAASARNGTKYPKVCTAMKDLGVQTTLNRCRRVGVQRQRIQKGLRRASRLWAIPKAKRIQLICILRIGCV